MHSYKEQEEFSWKATQFIQQKSYRLFSITVIFILDRFKIEFIGINL